MNRSPKYSVGNKVACLNEEEKEMYCGSIIRISEVGCGCYLYTVDCGGNRHTMCEGRIRIHL